MNHGLVVLNRITILVLSFSFFGISIIAHSQTSDEQTIYGKLLLDTIWEPTVYLSHIPTFNDMNTMSQDMIIAQAEVDGSGRFSFNSSFLPDDDQLFRIHISKKDAPAASLIIGGKEENHLFFLANKRTDIQIANHNRDTLFGSYTIKGYHPNNSLLQIEEIVRSIDSLNWRSSMVKRDFVAKSIHEKLRHIADTSSHPLVSLYALHHSKFESTFLSNQDFYRNYLKKWAQEDSSYFQALRAKLPNEENGSNYGWIILMAGGFFLVGFFINYALRHRKNKMRTQLRTLSVQERKIFRLIQLGKSNKEISEEYNIGLSTVKSHVGNIYTKLNIKSRKEAMDFK